MSGLDNLPKAKWVDVDEQPILKGDFEDIETAILQLAGFGASVLPTLYYNDATSVRVKATSDTPVGVMMSGFPDVDNLGQWIDAGLTDVKYRENTSNTDMDFDTSTTFWGNEKSYQWYCVFAVAGDSDSTFTLKAMPWLRVSSQATQTITLRNSLNTANIGYGWATDSLAGYKLYFISGSSKGLIREVSANNNDNTTGGTITYTGSALTVAAGDWFIALPDDTNFRWVGDFYNNASGNISPFYKKGHRVLITPVSLLVSASGVGGYSNWDNAYHSPPLAAAIIGVGYDTTNGGVWSIIPYSGYGYQTYPLMPVPLVSTYTVLRYEGSGGVDITYYVNAYEYPPSLS